MTQTHHHRSQDIRSTATRAISWAGLSHFSTVSTSYVVFFVTFLYAIGFVAGLVVPKTIDTGTVVPTAEAMIVNLALMSVFAIQHSVMARKQFKQWWTRFVPASVERSTYVLLVQPDAGMFILAVAGSVPVIDVADRRSIRRHGGDWPVVRRLADRVDQHVPDQPFRAVRLAAGGKQPGRTGDTRATLPDAAVLPVRAAPDLSWFHHRILGRAGNGGGRHLLCAAVTTAYIVVGILLEERDLVDVFGDDYRR